MGLLTKELWITVNTTTREYYELRGYKIPKVKKGKKYVVERGTQILVKVEDLKSGSNELVEVQCDDCGKIYQIEYYLYKKSLDKYNGIFCFKCVRANFFSGENGINYNPNLSAEERSNSRRTKEYQEFHLKVIMRDSYTCRRCGSKEDIDVHHLNGYDLYIEGRIDETNAVCLCRNCHRNFHSLYGYKHCTIKQYMEWMNITDFNRDDLVFKSTTRQIYCYEEDRIYSSASEFRDAHNLKDNSNIYKLCNHKSNGKYQVLTVAGCHLIWLDEYLQIKKQNV